MFFLYTVVMTLSQTHSKVAAFIQSNQLLVGREVVTVAVSGGADYIHSDNILSPINK